MRKKNQINIEKTVHLLQKMSCFEMHPPPPKKKVFWGTWESVYLKIVSIVIHLKLLTY